MKRRLLLAVLCALPLASPSARVAVAADTWFEIKSANFTVWANANDGNTRTLLWQLEQMRNVAKTLWPWMKVDLPRPMIVVAAKNEQTMKQLAPQYWEVKGGVRPASVWVTAPDRHYIAIRTDMGLRDDVMVNPHTSAYFSYANLVFSSSFSGAPPLWLSRGLAGVLSNTLVRQADVIVGAAIPWHLETLRARRLPLRQMLTITSGSAEFRTAEGMRYFDAQSWAFVHYLMFGEQGVHAPKLNAFVARIEKGEAPPAAFASAIGNVDEYEHAFATYVNRSLFPAARIKVDLGLDRERFPARAMSAAEGAIARASFHVAMRRPAEARALIDEAAKADPKAAGPSALEGLMLDQGGNIDGAKAAYSKAVELGTDNPYVLYRLAMLNRQDADAAGRERIEELLARAVELNPNFAAAHAALAEIRSELQRPQRTFVTHMQRAVSLEPSNPWHRLAAARVLFRVNAHDEARKAAEAALQLAEGDARARDEAERILARLKR